MKVIYNPDGLTKTETRADSTLSFARQQRDAKSHIQMILHVRSTELPLDVPGYAGSKKTEQWLCTCVLNLPSSAKQRDMTNFFKFFLQELAPPSPSSFAHPRRAPSLARFSISVPRRLERERNRLLGRL